MKITISRKDLIDAGNRVQLMPTTEAGWIYLAETVLKDVFPGYHFTSSPPLITFRTDGSVKNISFSNVVKY